MFVEGGQNVVNVVFGSRSVVPDRRDTVVRVVIIGVPLDATLLPTFLLRRSFVVAVDLTVTA